MQPLGVSASGLQQDGQAGVLIVVSSSQQHSNVHLPLRTTGGPLVIKFSMRLLDIYQINHKDFSISIGVIYSLSWTDNRLVILGNKSFINMDVDFIKTLWVSWRR